MKKNVIELRDRMTLEIMEKTKIYTRRELTILFWQEYPKYCAKLLIKSTVNDRTPIDVLEGIISFDRFKLSHNTYTR